jgi:hypothetical protein
VAGWGLSSAGRAPALQAGGHRFDPDSLHQFCSVSMWRSGFERGPQGRAAWPDGGHRGYHGEVSVRRSLCSPKRGGICCCPFGTLGGVFTRFGCCGLLQCESGSGASLGVPRSAKSDRMYRHSDMSVSETAAKYVQRRCEYAE